MNRISAVTATVDRLIEDATPTVADRKNLRWLSDLLHRRRLLTTGEAADMLGVKSINTVKRWIDDGYLKARTDPRGQRKVLFSSVAGLQAKFDKADTATDLMPRRQRSTPRKLHSA